MNTTLPPIPAGLLKQMLQEEPAPILIDVMPGECFGADHLPGAGNACVYEVDFVEQTRRLAPNQGRKVVVYGSGLKSSASFVAAAKLRNAGWTNVLDFQGGLKEWRAAGLPIEGTHAGPAQSVLMDRKYLVDVGKSLLEWTGRGIGGNHSGTFKLSAGEIIVEGGKVARGQFTIDMKSIVDTDIGDPSKASVLIRHLMSEDFFEVSAYPEGGFIISRVDSIPEVSPGRPNHTIRGGLILKGIEREIEFPAQIDPPITGSMTVHAHFDIDRTEWNVTYGSGRFFEHLGKHLVHDLVSIQLKIVAA